MRKALALAIVSSALAPAPAVAASTAQDWLLEQGYVAPAGARIVACHGYGCVRRTVLSLEGSLLHRASALLKAARGSPQAERQALGHVVQMYKANLAATFGGRPDTPRSPPSLSGVHGQMDCLDETANTTSLLLVLEQHGLLSHHRVERPQSRGFFLDGRYPHFSAIVTEKRTGQEWAVDPWAKSPGQAPEILPLAEWRQDS